MRKLTPFPAREISFWSARDDLPYAHDVMLLLDNPCPSTYILFFDNMFGTSP